MVLISGTVISPPSSPLSFLHAWSQDTRCWEGLDGILCGSNNRARITFEQFYRVLIPLSCLSCCVQSLIHYIRPTFIAE